MLAVFPRMHSVDISQTVPKGFGSTSTDDPLTTMLATDSSVIWIESPGNKSAPASSVLVGTYPQGEPAASLFVRYRTVYFLISFNT
jgi:hypothetical protein